MFERFYSVYEKREITFFFQNRLLHDCSKDFQTILFEKGECQNVIRANKSRCRYMYLALIITVKRFSTMCICVCELSCFNAYCLMDTYVMKRKVTKGQL